MRIQGDSSAFRDDVPRSSTPYINYFLIAANVLVFLFELSLSGRSRAAFIYQFGIVPLRIDQGILGQAPLDAAFVSIFTSMFLHASWLHLIANMWVLWIFGDNIEDQLGHFRYLLFYLICGLGAAFLHILFNQGSQIPSVGASGAIAGIMGAFFLLYPNARVLTLIPFFWFPAWIVLGYWFVVQFLSGAATSIAQTNSGGGIAFWAHVGGFVVGAGIIRLFPSRTPRLFYSR
jgi:membrane associated rhomboid family serine protease